MTHSTGLSLDQAPPIGVPLRFFLTAPLFGLAAAILALWQGPELFSSRWSPAMLGATHLLTLGFMSMVMMGAVLQMLPVVAGTPVPQPVLLAGIVHILATAGTALFAFGMAFSLPTPLKTALPVLGIAMFLFSFAVIVTLRRALPQNMAARAMRLAALMLALTSILGLALLENHAFGWWLQDREALTDLHLTWGLLGWLGILVAGVSYQVVPMFQLTPPYPAHYTRWLPLALFVLLLGLIPATIQFPALRTSLGALLAAGFASFALLTLWLQAKRRRKLPDVTLNYWRGGMGCLLLAIVLWLAARLFPVIGAGESYNILLGMLMIVGFALSAINGMLYKIVPFLIWFHLQSQRGPGGPSVPNTRQILAETRTRRQMWLHFAALFALLCASLSPHIFAYPAACLFGASNLWLCLNIVSAVRVYRP